jgi:phosphoserine phosphatase
MKYIVSDIEGTLTTGSSWKGLRTYYKDHFSPWRYKLFFARWVPRYILVGLGLVSRRTAIREWMLDEVQLFKGMRLDEFKLMAVWIVENEMWLKRRVETILEIEEYRREGFKVAVVSSAYQPIVDAFAMRLDAIPIGSPLLVQNGKVAGVQQPINAYEQKVKLIRVKVGDAVIQAAYGDSLSDLPMLEMSQEPVAVFPDKKMRKAVIQRGWRIIE